MTVYTDNANRANSTNLGADWTEIQGDVQISSNRFSNVTSGARCVARYEHDLASSDHYAQAISVGTVGVGTAGGVIVRADSSAITYYMARARQDGSATDNVQKVVAGVATTIGTATTNTPLPQLVRLEISGSTLTYIVGGVTELSFSDTAITTGVRCGVYVLGNGGADRGQADDWEAGDLSTSTPIADSDTGAGTEGTPALTVDVSSSDTGAGTDAATLAVQVADSDTGTGTDAGQFVFTDTDTGTGVDNFSALLVDVSSSDSAAGADAATLSVDIVTADTGTGSDAEGTLVTELSLTDGDVITYVEASILDKDVADTETAQGYDLGTATGARGPLTARLALRRGRI